MEAKSIDVSIPFKSFIPVIEKIIKQKIQEEFKEREFDLLAMADFLPQLHIANRTWLNLVSKGKAPQGFQITDSDRSTRWKRADIHKYISLRQEGKWWNS